MYIYTYLCVYVCMYKSHFSRFFFSNSRHFTTPQSGGLFLSYFFSSLLPPTPVHLPCVYMLSKKYVLEEHMYVR